MKRILITGVTGFVGKHLAAYLLSQKSYEIVGIYRSEKGLDSLEEVKDKIKLIHLDLNDNQAVEDVIVKEKPDVIIHLAAQASSTKSFEIPLETLTTNITTEFSILEALRKHDLKHVRVLIISSAEIYGAIDPFDIPVNEKTQFKPATAYAVSKIAQDYLSYQYFLSYKLDIVRVRPFNHIGPGQRAGFVVADFAKQIAEIEKGKREPVISVGNLNAKRDFTDVRDMVKAYEAAILKGKAGEVYNIGSGKSYKIDDILQKLLALSSKKITVNIDQTRFRPIDVPEIVCDCSKFHQLTGWETSIQFEKTLQDILDYWRSIV